MSPTLSALPILAPLDAYRRQAQELLDAWNADDPGAVEIFRHNHPRLLDETIPWLPKNLSESEVRSVSFESEGRAELVLARSLRLRSLGTAGGARRASNNAGLTRCSLRSGSGSR